MKRLLPFLSIAVLFTACSTKPKESPAPSVIVPVQQAYNPDTMGLAEFQEWKAQNEMATADNYQQPTAQYAAASAPKARAPRKVQAAPVRKATHSETPAPEPVAESTPAPVSTGSGEEVAVNTESSNEAKEEEKKGWSKAAKGAVIGGAGGAAIGAVIYKKNPALGAAIGGVLGGGGGYIIGRKMDKKDGRY